MAGGLCRDERFDSPFSTGASPSSTSSFISLVALMSGVLNAQGRFTEATIVPVLMNLMFIAAMLLADRWAGTWG
jgi:putative peptidoglycan lipid II flippase